MRHHGDDDAWIMRVFCVFNSCLCEHFDTRFIEEDNSRVNVHIVELIKKTRTMPTWQNYWKFET